jgi:poly-gamma-glutamate synthase PgsB/CapB
VNRNELPLYLLFMVTTAITIGWMVWERWKHNKNLDAIKLRIVINGIRGKSSVTRLTAGALRTQSTWNTVAKTTGTAAMFIYPGGREKPVRRSFGVVNVIEQKHIIQRAANLDSQAIVVECMAVLPELQELNQEVMIRAHIVVITNVREDHLEEMGPTLVDVARSLSRSMPHGGICITAETELFDILQEEADARSCELVYANASDVSDFEMEGFDYITFKDNVACALKVAELCGIPRATAMSGMYAAPPDPGVLRVDEWEYNGRDFRVANLFAANDPNSTLMNLRLLQQRKYIGHDLSIIINCRPDRVERNGQMGDLMELVNPRHIFLMGMPTRSAVHHIAEHLRSRIIDLEKIADGVDTLERITQALPEAGHDLVMIGNVHGGGEELLAAIAELAGKPDHTLDDELDELAATVILKDPTIKEEKH